jgi:hypothetical protein
MNYINHYIMGVLTDRLSKFKKNKINFRNSEVTYTFE